MCKAVKKIFGGGGSSGGSSSAQVQNVTPAAIDVSAKDTGTDDAATEAAKKKRARAGFQSTSLADLASSIFGGGKNTLG